LVTQENSSDSASSASADTAAEPAPGSRSKGGHGHTPNPLDGRSVPAAGGLLRQLGGGPSSPNCEAQRISHHPPRDPIRRHLTLGPHRLRQLPRRLVHQRRRHGPYPPHQDNYTDIYVMRPDGSGVKRLTHARAYTPAWSRDGKHIVFSAPGLFVMRGDGSGITSLPVAGVGETALPDWV
jgi:hypothetical protein